MVLHISCEENEVITKYNGPVKYLVKWLSKSVCNSFLVVPLQYTLPTTGKATAPLAFTVYSLRVAALLLQDGLSITDRVLKMLADKRTYCKIIERRHQYLQSVFFLNTQTNIFGLRKFLLKMMIRKIDDVFFSVDRTAQRLQQ